MAPITALLHVANHALCLGRALETLRPCEEILVVNHGSDEATLRIAREYGARIVAAGASPAQELQSARHDWILCLEPHESLSEGLEASLFNWKLQPLPQLTCDAFSVFLREETATGWVSLPSPQTRLVPRSWHHWNGHSPGDRPSAVALEGELLRFLSC